MTYRGQGTETRAYNYLNILFGLRIGSAVVVRYSPRVDKARPGTSGSVFVLVVTVTVVFFALLGRTLDCLVSRLVEGSRAAIGW